jgi:hypothetical protein
VTSEYKAKGRDGKRFRRCADKRDVAIAAKELDVCIDVMLSRHGIQDEVKAASVLFHLLDITRNDDLVHT